MQAGGSLVLRNEDLDRSRASSKYVSAMLEDLRWLGLHWHEGPDCGGPHGPYNQSERLMEYRRALDHLKSSGLAYPCACSRQDVLRALAAPHQGEDEPVYPGTCRPEIRAPLEERQHKLATNWRFRVPDGKTIRFVDGHFGAQEFTCGKDFGDFVIWRHDDLPSYQLAVVVDDAAMRITEVVRGEDLLRSTARQLLLYKALGWTAPAFFHCPLMRDASGQRLAKRHDSLSLTALRAAGETPESVRARFNQSQT
ncbi:Glutamate--tRNA ligase 2 [bioreactor metagenome]|uniref:Glutamate--tRNA ligase 2 n=1 Tax=bioreactor metagenome TaxID=1076179 RepID=A0A645C8P4_9ZZZZ